MDLFMTDTNMVWWSFGCEDSVEAVNELVQLCEPEETNRGVKMASGSFLFSWLSPNCGRVADAAAAAAALSPPPRMCVRVSCDKLVSQWTADIYVCWCASLVWKTKRVTNSNMVTRHVKWNVILHASVWWTKRAEVNPKSNIRQKSLFCKLTSVLCTSKISCKKTKQKKFKTR